MKKHLTPFILLLCALTAQAAELKMMVLSDPHVLHQSLVGTKDYSSQAYLTEYSQLLFDHALRMVKDSMPDVLLIPGDLTYNGDSVSHRYVANELTALTKMGIRVVVIPGNHDIDEPGAKTSSATAVVTGPVSQEQFRALYDACGYKDAVEIAEDGLSYMIYLDDRTALICMNSAMDNTAQHQSSGGITEATLDWAEGAIAKALAAGRYPFGVTHHQMVQHFDNQQLMDVDHIANINDEVLSTPSLANLQRRLVDAGLTTIFTGHMHIMSTKFFKTKKVNSANTGRTIYDVSTNALCGYAGAMRMARFSEGELTLSYVPLGDVEGLSYADRLSKAEARNTNMVNSILNKVSSRASQQVGATAAALIKATMEGYVKADYTKLFCYLAEGDEYRDPERATTHAEKCISDYSNLTSNILSLATLMRYDVTSIQTLMNEGRDMLYPTIYSIMYNALGADALGIDEADRNQPDDWNIVIPAQYKLQPTANQIESTQGALSTRKLLRNGELLILRSGKLYNVAGQAVL